MSVHVRRRACHTKAYSCDPCDLSNRFVHLTNYSIQKKSRDFVEASSEDASDSHKWSFATLRRKLRDAGHDDVNVWERMQDAIVKIMISIEPVVVAAIDMYKI